MKIGGLNTFSVSDFPGKVSAVVFAQGCNFRCPFCHNSQLIPTDAPKGSLISEDQVLRFFEDRKNQLEGAVISGGEPTIQPHLPTFCRRIKKMGYAVKLDTNGSKPKVLKELLENKLLDYIAMDIKAPLQVYERIIGTVLPPTDNIKGSIALISKSGIDHEFRTTVVEALLSPEEMQSIQKLVPAGSTYRLQKFCPEHAFAPTLRATTNMYLGDPSL